MIPPKFKPFSKDEQVVKFLGDLEKILNDIIDQFPRSVKLTGTLVAGVATTLNHNLKTPHLIVNVNPPSIVWSDLTLTTINLFSPVNTDYTLILMEVK